MRPESIWNQSANELADYVWNSDAEQENYEFYREEGNDPREHILYHSAVILGYERDFDKDIEEYEELLKGEKE